MQRTYAGLFKKMPDGSWEKMTDEERRALITRGMEEEVRLKAEGIPDVSWSWFKKMMEDDDGR